MNASKQLLLTLMACLVCAGAQAQDEMANLSVMPDYFMAKPTADEVHWQQEFRSQFQAGHYREAAQAANYLEMNLQGRTDAKWWYILGVDYNEVGEYQRAIPVLNYTLSLIPDNSYAVNSLGVAYEGLGNFDAALSTYRRAAGMGNNAAQQNADILMQKLSQPAGQRPYGQ